MLSRVVLLLSVFALLIVQSLTATGKYLLVAKIFPLLCLNFFVDKVICYYASWAAMRPENGQFVAEDINPNLCTHVNYAFLGLNNDGSLQILDEENDINQGKFRKKFSLFSILDSFSSFLTTY
jgi:hypothetical protein